MTFLAPLFLLGAAAIAAPIVVHLIRRTTRERFVFSSLMFLRPSPPRLSRRNRFEHLVLLLLRCAAILLLAVAFARPFFAAKTPPVGSGLAKRVLILVDVSASMRRDGIWDDVRRAVTAQLRAAGPTDQYAVFTYATGTQTLVSFAEWNRTALGDRVAVATARFATVSPGWTATHLGNALISAADAVTESDGQAAAGVRQIVLISDVQAGSRLDGLQGYDWPKGVELLVVPIAASHPTNAGIQVIAESHDAAANTAQAVRVRVTNSATAKREQFQIALRGANAAISSPIDAYVPPGQSRVFTVPWPKVGGPFDAVILQGDDDAFDNLAHVVPPLQRSATVIWYGRAAPKDARAEELFLKRALTDTPRLGIKLLTRDPSAVSATDEIADADLVFVADALSPDLAARLRAAIQAGKTVAVVARTPDVAGALGVLLGRTDIQLTEAKVANYAMFGEIDFRHRFFAPFANPRFSDFTKIHVWHYRRADLGAVPDAHVIARFDTGDPAMVEIPSERGRVVVFTTSWHPDDSQLAISSKFVPLMWSLLELAGTAPASAAQIYVGEPIAVPDGGFTAVQLPNGAVEPLPTGATTFSDTQVPGIYEFSAGAKRVRVAVNLDSNESRTAPLALDELEQLGVPAKSLAAAEHAATVSSDVLQGLEAENRQKLWRWAIAATLLVLLIETALAGWTAKRSRNAQEVAA